MVNKVRIEIAGSRYVIATPEGEERVLSLGREIDAQVRQLMDGNDRVSLNDALVLCCLNYANAYKKSEESADNMRTQLTDYLEDAARARMRVYYHLEPAAEAYLTEQKEEYRRTAVGVQNVLKSCEVQHEKEA